MNDQIDMQSFLSAISDCRKDIQTNWAVAFDLNPGPIKKFKETIQSYALYKGSDILSFYAYADGRGKYERVETYPLMDLVSKYEGYHDDFFEFIKTIISPDWRVTDEEEACLYLQKGLDADRQFRKNLLENIKKERRLVSDAVKDLDAIMAFMILLDKIYDAFIYLRARIEDNKKVYTAIEMYFDSTMASMESLFSIYTDLIDTLADIRDHGEQKPPKFVLL